MPVVPESNRISATVLYLHGSNSPRGLSDSTERRNQEDSVSRSRTKTDFACRFHSETLYFLFPGSSVSNFSEAAHRFDPTRISLFRSCFVSFPLTKRHRVQFLCCFRFYTDSTESFFPVFSRIFPRLSRVSEELRRDRLRKLSTGQIRLAAEFIAGENRCLRVQQRIL